MKRRQEVKNRSEKGRRKITALGVVNVLMLVFTIIAAFSYRTSFHVFFVGQEEAVESGTSANSVQSVEIDNDTELRVEIDNREKITIQQVTLSFDVEKSENYSGSQIAVEILDRNDELLEQEMIKGKDLADGTVELTFKELGEINGDFAVVLKGEGFHEDEYPALIITEERNIADRSVWKAAMYQDGTEISGQPTMAFGTELRDNLYFPMLAVLTVMISVIHLSVILYKKGFFYKKLTECGRTKLVTFLLLGGYLLYELWSKNAGEICSWMGPWYVLDYGVGMGSRLFVGSIMKVLFYDTFLDKSIAYYFVMTIMSILVLEIAYLMAECVSRAKDNYRKGVILLALFYIASPGSVGYLWNSANLGRLDMYLFVIALAAVFVSVAVKNRIVRYGLLTVMSVSMFAIHQGNLFTYFPVIFMVCICSVFKEQKINWKDFWGSVVVALSSAVTFFYFHFFSYVKFDTQEQMVSYVANRTNLVNNPGGIYMEYFSGLYGMFENCFAIDYYRIAGVIQVLVLWPMVLLGSFVAVKAIGYWKEKKIKWRYSPYPYLALFNLIYIPVFIFECDWGRWFAAIITTKTIEFLYLFYIKDEGMMCAVEKLGRFIKNKEILIATVLLYLAALEKFGSARLLEIVERLYKWLFPFVA